jgi:ABC-type dipeptide/oligopeptide/nickel transport system permease component
MGALSTAWLLRRTGEAALALLAATVLIFAVVHLTPGDPAAFVLRAQSGNFAPSAEELAAKRQELGLDRPVPIQYAHWIGGLLQGDLGTSYKNGQPVAEVIGGRLAATARLTLAAALASVLLAVVLSAISVAAANRMPDTIVQFCCVLIASSPAFVVAIIVADIVTVRLGWLPLLSDGGWRTVIMPAVCIAVPLGTWWAQLLRSHMLAAQGSGFAEVARARGASAARIILTHSLPNAVVPLLSVLAVGIGLVFAGTAVVEAVFNWPGLGTLMLTAVKNRDLAVVQALALIGTSVFILLALMADLASGIIDPRLAVRQ